MSDERDDGDDRSEGDDESREEAPERRSDASLGERIDLEAIILEDARRSLAARLERDPVPPDPERESRRRFRTAFRAANRWVCRQLLDDPETVLSVRRTPQRVWLDGSRPDHTG